MLWNGDETNVKNTGGYENENNKKYEQNISGTFLYKKIRVIDINEKPIYLIHIFLENFSNSL